MRTPLLAEAINRVVHLDPRAKDENASDRCSAPYQADTSLRTSGEARGAVSGVSRVLPCVPQNAALRAHGPARPFTAWRIAKLGTALGGRTRHPSRCVSPETRSTGQESCPKDSPTLDP